MTEEQAIDILKNCIADYVVGEYCKKCADWLICDTKNENCYFLQAIDIVINLIQKQDKRLKRQFKIIQKRDKNIDEIKEIAKKDWEERCRLTFELEKQDTEINKLNNVIEEYEKECRQFKAFCRKIRRDDKHDVDEFNQGQEQKCNQFLNLLAGEKHWTYEGKYFDETDKQIEKMKEDK